MAPLKICSVDIEAFAPIDPNGKYPFPDPEVSSHQTSCICVRKRLLNQGAEEGEYVFFSYKPLDMARVDELCKTENLCVSHKDSRACNSEKEMFAQFITFCEREKFDVIVGWNTLDFDMRYIYHRCKLYGIDLYRIAKWGTKETCRPLRLDDVTRVEINGNEFRPVVASFNHPLGTNSVKIERDETGTVVFNGPLKSEESYVNVLNNKTINSGPGSFQTDSIETERASFGEVESGNMSVSHMRAKDCSVLVLSTSSLYFDSVKCGEDLNLPDVKTVTLGDLL
eukprot:1136447-Prymnesium_polylepis.1